MLRHLLWAAVACGRPLQLQLRSTDPRRLAGFAAATAGLGSDLVLLNSCPYHRHAAQLAHAHPHVYADAGAAPARTGVRAAAVLAEILEPAPFGKVLFSSGAQGLPELHVVGAHQFREALGRGAGRLGGGRRAVTNRCDPGRRDDRVRQRAQGVRAGVTDRFSPCPGRAPSPGSRAPE